MTTLPVFLLARLDEDEAAARGEFGWAARRHGGPPARVLADVEAKRRIVAEHGPHEEDPDSCVTCSAYESTDITGPPFPCPTLKLLALPYADHPDYRAEWKP